MCTIYGPTMLVQHMILDDLADLVRAESEL